MNPKIETTTLMDFYAERVKFPRTFICNMLGVTPQNVTYWEETGYIPDAVIGKLWRKAATDLAKIKKLQLAKDAAK